MEKTGYVLSLPTTTIERAAVQNFELVGHGPEGNIYKFDDKTAFKLFIATSDKDMNHKFEKLHCLGRLREENICLPRSVVVDENGRKTGYLMPLIEPHERYQHFWSVKNLGQEDFLRAVGSANETIKSAHNAGIVFGDLCSNNILFDKSLTPRFVDIDNCEYMGYQSESHISKTMDALERIYNHKFKGTDNDKFLFATIVIDYYLKGFIMGQNQDDEFFKRAISMLNVSSEIKKELRAIFSDSHDKPYIGDVVTKIDPDAKILSKERRLQLSSFANKKRRK